jgi:hypothetical protein
MPERGRSTIPTPVPRMRMRNYLFLVAFISDRVSERKIALSALLLDDATLAQLTFLVSFLFDV